ncbi:glycosyltransferase family 4 protein [Shewanella goraebulensis]|uniref:glycosyltransferase family 4 protein n=1 Tax=Shewanella goraebulensis TaxID=3050637 RepID=UPI00254EC7F1|nr:glycosyltransferase family 4 protein [Shewanella goraebulensis]
MLFNNNENKIVVFCPLPPKPNGIADYFLEQVPYFSQNHNLNIVIEDNHPEPIGVPSYVTVIRLTEYLQNRIEFSHAKHVYHVGNNHDTQYLLPVLLSTPGVVIVHDLNLHHLIGLTTLSCDSKPSYTEALAYQYGRLGKLLGQQLESFGWKGSFSPEELELNASVLDSASQIIVHSQYSADRIMARGNTNVSVIPHHLAPTIAHYPRKLKNEYRNQLGLPQDKLIFTSMGFIAKAKQIKAVLTALIELDKSGIDFVYVLAGQCKPHEYDVYADIQAAGLRDKVIVTGFLNEQEFYQHIGATDLIINLRYPTGGESSGTLTRALGMGVCCLVVNIGPFAELPDDVACKLDYDDSFQVLLTESLLKLANNSDERTAYGIKAKGWIERTHHIEVTTKQYLEVIASSTAPSIKHSCAFSEQLNVTDNYFLPKALLKQKLEHETDANLGLAWRESLIPLGVSGQDTLLLNTAKDEEALFSSVLQYGTTDITAVDFDSLAEDNYFQHWHKYKVVYAIFPIATFIDDPVYLLAILNGLCNTASTLVLTIKIDHQDVDSAVPLNQQVFIEYLEAAGFKVTNVETAEKDINFERVEQLYHQSQWCFTGQLISRMVDRYPLPQYPQANSEAILLTQKGMKSMSPKCGIDYMMEPL